MKKIYILTAVFALLTLSLNAQVADKGKEKISEKKGTVDTRQAKFKPKTKVPTMNELLSGIKGMSTILQASSQSHNTVASSNGGSLRAPLKINADECTVGPFEGNNVSSTSYGYGNAYPNPQWITITTQLTRDEFIDHVGDEIVGFRLALGGNTSNYLDVSDFIALPLTSSGTDTDNILEWNVADLAGPTVFSDYTLFNNDITSTNFTTGTISPSAPWSAYLVSNQSNGSFYITDRTNGYLRFTVPEGFSNSDFKFVFSTRDGYYSGYFTFTPSTGSAVTVNTSAANTVYECELTGLNAGDEVTIKGRSGSASYSCDFTYMHVYVKGTYQGEYAQLNGAYTGSDPNWHEFYLPEPIEFNVASDVEALRMGYTVRQYPSSDTEHYLYPIALNDESKSHDHYIYMYYPQETTGMVRLTGWVYADDGVVFPSGWTVPNANSGDLDGSVYFSGQNGGNVVINTSALQGASTVTVKVTAGQENSYSAHSISVNGTTQTLTTALVEYTFENVDATSGITIHYSDYYVDFSTIEVYGEGTVTDYVQQWYGVNYSENGDLAVQLIFKSSLPRIKVSPETLTISDNGSNNTFTVEGSNLGTDPGVGVNPSNGFSTTTSDQSWGFDNIDGSVNGTVTVTYEGRDLLATGTVTVANDQTSATVTVNYVPDLYIYCDNGASPWNFSANPAIAMTNQGNGIYTATLQDIPDGSHILFGRASGLTYYWEGDENRLFFGASTDGGDWGYGVNNWGYLDTDPRDEYPVKYHPIYFPEGGTYFITIDANNYTFTISELPAPENVAATANSEDHTATVTWAAPSSLPNGLEPVSYYNVYLDGQLVGSVPADQALTYTFSNLAESDHTVEISAVYPGGAESEKVPAEFTIMGKTDMPTISVVTNADGSKTITATGNGEVLLYVDGTLVTNPYTIMPSTDGDITVTVTATAQENGKLISDPATETVTVPEAGRSPMPTITFTDNGDGTYTITATGTGEVNLYINDAEHGGTSGDPVATGQGSVSITVEEHSQEMTINVQATNQEDGLAISRTAEGSYTIPAMSTQGFLTLDPQPANATAPIDMSKLMFVDRFSVDIPEDNSHPFMYDYTLEETQVRQRSSNTVEVYVEKTGSKGQGFYTLKQIDNDKDAKLVMDVENAAMDFNLSELSAPFFYTVEREEEADGESYWGWNAILQRTSVGNYKQTLKYDTKGNLVYNYNDTILPGPHVQLDLDTITGDYNDYKAYVPVVWTMGFDRVNYDENNPTHNSYGASVWTTGVADVAMASSEAPKAERQTNSWNSVNWTAEGGPASLYILDNVVATATMPTVNTLDYEPYMFRIFVKSDNNKLRPYTVVPAGDGPYDGEHLDAGEGTTKGPICVWSGYINDPKNNQPKKLTTENGEIDNPDYNGVEITEGTGDGGAVTYTFKKVKVDRPAGYDENHNPLGPWDQDDVNAMFGALDELANMTTISLADLEVFVRFYYIVKGTGEGHTPWIPTRANAESDPAGYGTQSPGKAPDPATGVIEIANHGEIVETIYYNMQGMTSDKPFDGINIVVNRYSDGAISVTKVITK